MANSIATFIAYFLVIGLCAVVIFVMVILPIILTKQYNKEQASSTKKHIQFNTPFCTFYWEDCAEQGYEGEVDSCGVFFELDNPVTPPEGGYEEYTLSQLDPTEDNDLEIEKLIQVLPRLKEIRPGKCYHKMESILSKKDLIDTEIKEYVADYFLLRPELIKENVSREDIVDSMELSFISVYRNGITEYSIFDAGDIYVDDLKIIVKADNTKEVKYRTYG